MADNARASKSLTKNDISAVIFMCWFISFFIGTILGDEFFGNGRMFINSIPIGTTTYFGAIIGAIVGTIIGIIIGKLIIVILQEHSNQQ